MAGGVGWMDGWTQAMQECHKNKNIGFGLLLPPWSTRANVTNKKFREHAISAPSTSPLYQSSHLLPLEINNTWIIDEISQDPSQSGKGAREVPEGVGSP